MSNRIEVYDSTTARWFVGEIESCAAELVTLQAVYRASRKPILERKNAWIDRAVDAGMNRPALLNHLRVRKCERDIEAIKANEDEDIAEARETLRKKLGDFANLPLGVAAVRLAKATPARKATKAPEVVASGIPDFSSMTLDEARAVLDAPKGKGRPSAAAVARRKEAEAVVAAHSSDATPGASGAQADAIADAMEPDEPADALSSLVDHDDNVRDLRPRFMART